MRARVLIYCLVVLVVAGATFLVLDSVFEDEPVGVFNVSVPVGFGGVGFEIDNAGFGGYDEG
jgi:hypothetical protein